MNFSTVISAQPALTQLTLSIEPGMSRRHDSLRDTVKTGVYQRGLSRMAAELDIPAGNLCNQINGTGQRHLSVDSMERYIERTGDVAPIYYLIERFLVAKADDNAAAIAQATHLLQQLQQLNLQPRV